MHQFENRYWWFVARRRLALRLLAKFCADARRIADVGCGTGAVLEELAAFSNPVGFDVSPLALAFSKERGLKGLVLADAQRLPARDATFDAAVSLDAIEHVPDDVAALSEIARVLRPGGVLVMSVPAFRSLWGPHDVALMHFRRYTKGQVRARLRDAGLEPIRLSYSVFALFPVVIAVRLRDQFLERFRKGPARVVLPPVSNRLNNALLALMAAEGFWIERTGLPWGSSVIAVARRPERIAP